MGLTRLQFHRWLALSALVFALGAVLSLTYPIEELSRRLSDLYFRLRGTQLTSQQVALVLIDDASISRYGRWPWSRVLLARLVRAASAQGPRALGLDIILSEPQEEAADRGFAEALGAAGNVVLATKIAALPEHSAWAEPLPLFARRAAGVGHVQAVLGPDGICRSVPAREVTLEGPRRALALEVARVARGVVREEVPDASRLADTAKPTSLDKVSPDFLIIDYHNQITPGQSPPPFLSVSARDLLEGKAGEELRGKAVLLGFAATEMSDRLPTPVSDRLPMPGVEIHANLVDGLLSGRRLQPVGWGAQTLVLLAASLVLTWVVLRWPGIKGLLVLPALLLAAYGAGYVLFAHAQRMVELGPLMCIGVLVAPAAQLENLIVVDRGLTRGLRQLQRALQPATPEMGGSLRAAMRLETPAPSQDLHWKVELLNELQAELGSLYAFDQTLLEAMQEGLAVFTSDGRLVFRNPHWQQFCDRLSWDPGSNLDAFVGALGDPKWREVSKRVSQPGARIESEVQLGGQLWQVRAIRLPSTHPGTGALMVVVTDLTARLERDRSRAEALGFVTHELRTPLVSIQGFAEFLLRYPQAAANSDAAAIIFRESRRLVAMINTYLDVLRLDSGAQPPRREVLDLKETVNQAERVVQPLAQAAGISVKLEMDSDLPLLRGDPNLIAGALLNLLSNAVKYSPQGSEVRLRVLARPDGVRLEVHNSGPVIPLEELARLFEPFYRRREQEHTAPGWGLGLAFVKRIAEGHGGRVEASSDAAGGTCFRIVLPTAPEPPSEQTSLPIGVSPQDPIDG
jgi:signal transduction histidine kinase/CHASE2 domain-containing sensor protein